MAKAKSRGSKANGPEPDAYEKLRSDIAARHATLSDRLQHIAEFALENPTEMALGTVAEVAKRAEVQPSAIVRFASALGYSGFTEMQQVFRLRLVASLAPSYKDRIERLKQDGPWSGRNDARAVLTRFVTEGIASLETLNTAAREPDLQRAIELLGSADTIYLLGLGGSYPVAAHLAYVLRKLGRRTVLLDALGGGLREQAVAATRADAVLAISFKQYNADTVRLFAELIARGVRAVSITDNLLSPIARGADVVFELHDMAEPALRTLVAPMSLAQALAVGLSLSQG